MPMAVEEERADQIFATPTACRKQPDLFGFLRIPFIADEVRPRLIGEIHIIIKIQAISYVARLRNEGHLAESPRQSQIDKIRSSVVGRFSVFIAIRRLGFLVVEKSFAELRRQIGLDDLIRHADAQIVAVLITQAGVEAFLRMPYAGNAGSGFFVDGHFAAGCRIAHPAVGVVIVSRDAYGGRIPEGNVNGAVDSAAAMLYFRGAANFPG